MVFYFVNSNSIDNRVVVYPNPASEYLIVSGLEGTSKSRNLYVNRTISSTLKNFESEKRQVRFKCRNVLVKVTNGVQKHN